MTDRSPVPVLADVPFPFGAHVSTAGGIRNAPGRGLEIGATAIQIFTKMPSRWAERPLDQREADDFRSACDSARIVFRCSHDSYLINLASPDPVLRDRSFASFRAELERSILLGLNAVVTHPGNATDGDPERGIEQNARLIQRALEETGPGPMVLLETTAGSGQALGARFEELAAIRDAIAAPYQDRIGVCFDTCHVYCAGYDIRDRYHEVMDTFDRVIGLSHLRLFHLNDSQQPLGSRRDRHAEIGEGALGDVAFRQIMNDARFFGVPRVLETPKGADPVTADRRNLARLRSLMS